MEDKYYSGGEIWRDIPGYPDYKVSNLGKVVSYRTSNPKILKGSLILNANGKAYQKVRLYEPRPSKEGHNYGIHVLVWKTFKGILPTDCYISFKNGNTHDPRLENLRLTKMGGMPLEKYGEDE